MCAEKEKYLHDHYQFSTECSQLSHFQYASFLNCLPCPNSSTLFELEEIISWKMTYWLGSQKLDGLLIRIYLIFCIPIFCWMLIWFSKFSWVLSLSHGSKSTHFCKWGWCFAFLTDFSISREFFSYMFRNHIWYTWIYFELYGWLLLD